MEIMTWITCKCFVHFHSGHGQCKQTKFTLNMLRKKTGHCNMLIHGGETLVFDNWELVPQVIRVSCECTINKLSVFSQYAAHDVPLGWKLHLSKKKLKTEKEFRGEHQAWCSINYCKYVVFAPKTPSWNNGLLQRRVELSSGPHTIWTYVCLWYRLPYMITSLNFPKRPS